MKNILEWLKSFVNVSIIRWKFQNLQIQTYVIIIAIVRRQHVISRLSHDVINFHTFLVC